MEVPYFARYAYAEKLAMFEDRASITASTLPAMERLTRYITDEDVQTAGPLPEAERALALAEFEGIDEGGRGGGPTQATKLPVVILIHGIRTMALWQNDIRRALEREGFIVELINYGYFNTLRFLLPQQHFIGGLVNKIVAQVRIAFARNPGADCSIIAEGFGTFLVARILRDHADIKLSRIILSGSVVPYDFPIGQVLGQIKSPLVNEVGSRDFWPVIAQTAMFGYGSSGTYGFRRPGVFDRWHNGKAASDFLNQEFCRKYWVPFLSEGRVVADDSIPEAPPLWLRAVSALQIKYVMLIALGVSSFLLWRSLSTLP
jgi:hypothetical protein